MENINEEALMAVFSAHEVLLFSIALTHPDLPRLRQVFAQMISKQIEVSEHPQRGAVLQIFEEKFRKALGEDLRSNPPRAP